VTHGGVMPGIVMYALLLAAPADVDRVLR